MQKVNENSGENRADDTKPTENNVPFIKSENEPRPLIYNDTERDLNSKILKMTMMIQEEFPELSKYLDEMPIHESGSDRRFVKMHELKKYYDSLSALLSKYRLEHPTRK